HPRMPDVSQVPTTVVSPTPNPDPASLSDSFAPSNQPQIYPQISPHYSMTYTSAQPPKPREPHKIATPFPLWAFLSGIVLIIIALAALQFTGSDWADGTLHIAFGAIGFSILIMLATIIRSFLGMSSLANPSRVRQYVSAILLIVVLLMSSGVALLIQPL